jgi:hypothetical protein
MMLWNDFLTNIKDYKTNYAAGQLKLDYGTLSTLLFAGAFDSMFGKELCLSEIENAAKELKQTLGSQAEPKEATKTELFGIADIDSEIRLLLWRNQALPTTKFQLAKYFKNALAQLGLREQDNDDIPFSNNSRDLWLSWNKIINDKRINRFYMQKTPPKTPCFIGMIEDVSSFTYKSKEKEKEALRFKLYTGIDCIPSVVIWPERDGKVHPALKKSIVKKSYGVANISLKEYRGDITASLIEWNTIRS